MGYTKLQTNGIWETANTQIDDSWGQIVRDTNGNVTAPQGLVTQLLNEDIIINNNLINLKIATLEKDLIRPLRELLSTKTSATNKAYAQTKVDDIEAQIQALRNTLK